MDYDVRIISTLEKVLPKSGMLDARPIRKLTGFRKQRVSFQIAYCYHGDYYLNQTKAQAFRNPYATVRVEGDFKEKVNIRKVENVPVLFPHEKQVKKYDSEYLGDEPGLYPDILAPFEGGVQMILEQWRALWVDCEIPEDAEGGDHDITIVFAGTDGTEYVRTRLTLHVVPAVLPKQKVLHTEWFYPDCLADYYGCDVFSEEHWKIIGNFMRTAASRGVNMIFTPLFTPALDTLIGGERTTVQLVKVYKRSDGYSFDYSLFHRWIELCKEVGFEYFEMSHLFAQWGAKFPPKVVAEVDGSTEKIFGWNTPVSDGGYEEFLKAFLPTLIEELKKEGILECTYFHISDEPTIDNADTYQKALHMVRPYIGDVPVIDALSHVQLYEEGIVKKPIPSSEYIHDFLDQGLENAWVYYCCGQGYRVSNRFIAMPAWRTRILGVQLYKYNMEGFLHWGFNFYNSQYSLHRIDPFRVNDSEDAFPAGDPFIVYPGKDGEPIESMRLPVMADAMLDTQLLEYLESLTSRDHVLELLEGADNVDIRFDQYPLGPDYLLDLWEKAALEIEKCLVSLK